MDDELPVGEGEHSAAEQSTAQHSTAQHGTAIRDSITAGGNGVSHSSSSSSNEPAKIA